jgi:hypothetical protein
MPPDLATACSFAGDEAFLGRNWDGILSAPCLLLNSRIFECLSHGATAIATLLVGCNRYLVTGSSRPETRNQRAP